MQLREFRKVVKTSLPKLNKILSKTGLSYDDGQDVIATVLDRAYRKQAYTGLTLDTAHSYLSSRVYYVLSDHRKSAIEKEKRECLLPEDTDSPLLRFVETVNTELEECPFCHQNTLNEYGTCPSCRTATPSNVVLHRGSFSIETVSLTLDHDLLQSTDINLAIESLTPMEQKVVKACIMGNESLESFGQIEAINRKTLWRIWVKARCSLQAKLAHYA